MGGHKLSRLHMAALVLLITCYCFLSISFLPTISGEDVVGSSKLVLGSQPPRCKNRCMNCMPCRAAIVIHPGIGSRKLTPKQEEENYYLVTWKCRCQDKLFQP